MMKQESTEFNWLRSADSKLLAGVVGVSRAGDTGGRLENSGKGNIVATPSTTSEQFA